MSHEEDAPDADASTTDPAPGQSLGDAGERSFRTEWDRATHPSLAVVEAVAAVTGREPTDFPPLYQSVDTDALDALLTGGPGRGPSERDANVRVSFAYDDVGVAVSSAGSIEVWPDDGDREHEHAGPRTAVELETRLRELFRAARRNGVSVRGGWAIRNGPEVPDWDVHVTRVAKPEDEDGDAPDRA